MRLSQSLATVVLLATASFAASANHYVIANDDVPANLPTGVSLYSIDTTGALSLKTVLRTGGNGAAAGYFGAQRVAALNNAQNHCIFTSNAESNNIAGIPIKTLKSNRLVRGSKTDDGSVNGIGLAVNSSYLYAGFTTSSTIATFQVSTGCKLKFVGDTSVLGLQGGTVDGMAITGDLLVVTYGDGSIESFNISSGVPVSNGDEQNSTASKGANWPSGIDITQDGHFAIFGDVSTSTIVEVSDISSGKLTPTVVYHLGSKLSAATVRLSPDESLLYIASTQSGIITAASFDTATGKLSSECASKPLKGFAKDWAYLGTVMTSKNSGTGGTLYVAEYGAPSSIGIVNVKASGGKCTLTESAKSPAPDSDSPGLLSIGVYPPRSF